MGNKPVMSHDPLAELGEDILGDVSQVPAEAKAGDTGPGSAVETQVVTLPEVLTIAEVAECYERLLERLQQGGEIVIDGSPVEQIDGAGLQLLAAFVREGAESVGRVSWTGCSEALREGARTLGLVTALGLA